MAPQSKGRSPCAPGIYWARHLLPPHLHFPNFSLCFHIEVRYLGNPAMLFFPFFFSKRSFKMFLFQNQSDIHLILLSRSYAK